MNFEKFFRLVSYSAVLCGFFSLWVSGTFGIVATVLFVAVLTAAWFFEDTRRQITERIGTALIVLALPVFYLVWRFQIVPLYGSETLLAGILARMILSLTAIKLLQKKSDRDWIFLYLMSFFQVLLAAGLSISPLYLVSFLVYLFVMVSAIIAFEIRKTSRAVAQKMGSATLGAETPKMSATLRIRRLPTTAITLIVFIVVVAVPLFFMLPRVGGAGFGGSQSNLKTRTGFSESVTLGRIGDIQSSDEVAMRVKLEPASETYSNLYFRGVALDTFDGKTWSKSRTGEKLPFGRDDYDRFQIDRATRLDNLVTQTIYLEPLDSPVLFALPKAVAIQGNFPIIRKDTFGALSFDPRPERISYKVVSDRSLPDPSRLRDDNDAYGSEMQNYLQLPDHFDKRIFDLAYGIASKERNRYDRAAAIEKHLQTKFGYTLEQKAGGDDPVADFLLNVREGHCEYFATSMVLMVRSQGIAARIVNGFHGGDYNSAADMTIVKERNAHSWVEVYFPKENVWVPFDPTPYSEQPGGEATGITGQFNKYAEALEAFWIENFVAFDNQEQRSLVRSVRNGFVDYQAKIAALLGVSRSLASEWLDEVRGTKGLQASLSAIGFGLIYVISGILGLVLLRLMYRKLLSLKVWGRVWDRVFARRHASIVEFYDRMLVVLADKGFTRAPHETPLEFAFGVGSAEVVSITETYNRVRFGQKDLSPDEANEVEGWLARLGDIEKG